MIKLLEVVLANMGGRELTVNQTSMNVTKTSIHVEITLTVSIPMVHTFVNVIRDSLMEMI